MMDFRGALALDLVDFEWICSFFVVFLFCVGCLEGSQPFPHLGIERQLSFRTVRQHPGWFRAAAAFRPAGFREPGLAHRPDTDGCPIVFFCLATAVRCELLEVFFLPPC